MRMDKAPEEIFVHAWTRLVRAQRIAMASIQRAFKAADLPPLEWYDALLELDRAGDAGLRPFELERKVAHGGKQEGDLLLVVAHIGRLLLNLSHQNQVLARVAGRQAGELRRQLVAKDKNQVSDRGHQVWVSTLGKVNWTREKPY